MQRSKKTNESNTMKSEKKRSRKTRGPAEKNKCESGGGKRHTQQLVKLVAGETCG